MEKKATAAIDIIYALPNTMQSILMKLEALEARNAMLEQKFNILIRTNATQENQTHTASQPVTTSAAPDASPEIVAIAEEEPSEIMEIRSKAPKKPSDPFNFGKAAEAPPPPPLDLRPPPSPMDGIRIPIKSVEPMSQNAINPEPPPDRQTATLIRGRLKERDGSSIAAVDVKVFDDKNIMVKKTKTAATGEWIAMLAPGEYTVEFTKPGQKPLFKPISVVSGKKELEILI